MFPIYLLSAQEDLNVDTQQNYKDGVVYYKSKDFENSYKLFSEIYLFKLMDSKFNFYYGRSAYETGHYETALAAFERVEMMEPSNLRVKLEMGRAYFMLGMYEDAKLQFNEVLQNPGIPKNVRSNIEFFLAKISSAEKKSFTYATVTLEWFHDSNINYGSLDSTYNIGGNVLPTQDEISGSGYQGSVDIVNIYNFSSRSRFAIKNRAFFYMKQHSNRDNAMYDVDYAAYSPSLLYKTPKYLFDIGIGIDTLSIDSKTYLQSLYFKPRVEYSHTANLKSLFYFKYISKYYKRDLQKDLDSNHYEISYGIQKIINNDSYIQINTSGLRESKKHGDRIDVDYDEYRADLNYAIQLNPTYGIELYGEAKRRRYDDFSNLFESKREDKAYTLSGTFNIEISSSLKFNLKYIYNRVNSNQEVFSYDKRIISAGLIKTF
jgi:hypothetical protein